MPDTGKRAREMLQSRHMVRLYDPTANVFLHLSGTGTTADGGRSWLGFRHQAITLKQRTKLRGDPWPFKQIARDLLDDKQRLNK